jgi:hypothetical protein
MKSKPTYDYLSNERVKNRDAVDQTVAPSIQAKVRFYIREPVDDVVFWRVRFRLRNYISATGYRSNYNSKQFIEVADKIT